jgi:ABC-type antimicrobial peptide transport system permease subunit
MTKVFGIAIGGVAVCGTFLALLGVYGVIAYGVTRRTREIGLRIALGATQSQVVGLFTSQGMRVTGIGLGVGLALAACASPLTRRFVWGVPLFDPLMYIAAALVFGGIAMLACWFAARRAARVEPTSALRSL